MFNVWFWKLALCPSSGKEAPNLVGPLPRAILSLGAIETVNLLRYAPENISSPSVSNRKMTLEKLTTRLKNKT